MNNYILILLMTLLGSIASVFFKLATNRKNFIFSIFFYLGGCLYFLSALLNIYLLKSIDYVVLLPLTSLSYVWTIFISQKFLKERIVIPKYIGILFIILGAFLIVK